MEFDIFSSWVLITFGRCWRQGWEHERQQLFARVVELLVVWQLGERRTLFAWRDEERRGESLTKSEGEDPVSSLPIVLSAES